MGAREGGGTWRHVLSLQNEPGQPRPQVPLHRCMVPYNDQGKQASMLLSSSFLCSTSPCFMVAWLVKSCLRLHVSQLASIHRCMAVRLWKSIRSCWLMALIWYSHTGTVNQ